MIGDVLPPLGLNIFSVICLLAMFFWSLKIALKKFAPFKPNKASLIILVSLTPVALYICILDLLPIMISNTAFLTLNGIDAGPYLAEFAFQRFTIIIPTSFTLLIFSGGMALIYVRENMHFRWLIPVLAASIILNFYMLASYGSYNMRLIEDPPQTQLYFFKFVPSWATWTFFYTRFLRLNISEIPLGALKS